MNVKPRDLAYIVSPYWEGARGHVVTVLRAAKKEEMLDGTLYVHHKNDGGAGWVCSGKIPDAQGGYVRLSVIADRCLRPIAGPSVTIETRDAATV